MTSAPHGDDELAFAGEPDRRRDVVGGRWTDDQRRTTVDHAVPDHAGLVIARIAGPQDLAGEAVGKGRLGHQVFDSMPGRPDPAGEIIGCRR